MKVFEPIEIKGMKLKNRLGFSSYLNNPRGPEGEATDVAVRWFETRARGGTGLIMTGAVTPTAPDPDQPASLLRIMGLALYDDKFIPAFARIAEAVHAHGAKLGVQIASGGPMVGQGPSLPPYPDEMHATDTVGEAMTGRAMPIKELSIEELEQIEDDFAATAARAKAAGADCVELHCTHGGASLLCSFVSPYYNKRTDKYGGSWEGRLRLTLETIQKVRKAVGQDYPILIRICADQSPPWRRREWTVSMFPRGITYAPSRAFPSPCFTPGGALSTWRQR